MAAAALEAAVEDDAPPDRAQKGHGALRAIAAGLVVGGAARIALKRTSTIRQLGGGLKMANRVREAPERLRDTVADGVADLRERFEGFEFGAGEPDEEEREPDEEEHEAEPPQDEEGEEPEAREPQATGGEAAEEGDEAEEAEEPDQAGEAEEPDEADEAEEPQASGDQGPDEAEEPQASGDEEPAEEGEAEEPPTLSGAETVDALVAEEPGNPGGSRSNTPDVLSLLSADREPPPILERLGGSRRTSPTSRPPVAPEGGSRRRSGSRQSRNRAGAR